MRPVYKRLTQVALVLSIGLALGLAALWQALPNILQSQASKFLAEKSGHRLSLAPPQIDLGELSLRLRQIRLEDPQGKPLLIADEILVDVSAASWAARAPLFDAVHISGLSAEVAFDKKGGHNWAPLIAAFAGKEEKPASTPLPRVDIRHFRLADARIALADGRSTPPFAARIDPLDIDLTELSTAPDDSGGILLTATTSLGAQLTWRGEIGINPLTSQGRIELAGLHLERLTPLLQAHLPLPMPHGEAGLTFDYRLGHADGKPTLELEKLDLRLDGLRLRGQSAAEAPQLAIDRIHVQEGRYNLAAERFTASQLAVNGLRLEPAGTTAAPVQLRHLALRDIGVDLGKRALKLAAIEAGGGHMRLLRDAQGTLDLPALVAGLVPPSPAPATQATKANGNAAAPWRFHLGKLTLGEFGVALRDESLEPPLEVKLDNIRFASEGLSENLGASLPWQLGVDVVGGGRLEATGKLTPTPLAVQGQLKLADLALKAAQPHVARHVALDLADGRLNIAGRFNHDAQGSRYRGGFSVDALRLVEAGSDKTFLAWKTLAARDLDATPARLLIPELLLDGLDTQLLIDKDKTLNAKRLLRKAPATEATPSASAASPAPSLAGSAAKEAPAKPAFTAQIERLRLSNGELDFADHSLFFPFTTHIHRLRGSINGLSTDPGVPGLVELEGQVDDFGMMRAAGEVDFFEPTQLLDLKLAFRNLDMARLTPYLATFAGRKIDSGKLSLALDYRIAKRQLSSDNQLIIDRLVLGEKVDAPGASSLPLDLAVAILEDSDGRIDLGLPISGSLDDPQFSYGHLVWKAIGNVLGKIVTAPFRALASLFGGSGSEKIEDIAFEAGATRLTPPEKEKLAKLAAGLGKRPGLHVSLAATWIDADRAALQDRALRRALLAHGKEGEAKEESRDPGPVSTRQPRIQVALEALYEQRLGKVELARLKEGFRRANPGQLEESTGNRMMSRLSGLLRQDKPLAEGEVERLKGMDFHTELYQRLRQGETVSDEALAQLAQRRGEHALAELKAAGVAETRLRLATGEKAASDKEDSRAAPLKLDLRSPQ